MPVAILSLISTVKLLLHHPRYLRLLPLFFVFIQSEFAIQERRVRDKDRLYQVPRPAKGQTRRAPDFRTLGVLEYQHTHDDLLCTWNPSGNLRFVVHSACRGLQVSSSVFCLWGSSEAHISALGVRSGCSAPSRFLLETMVWIKPR